MKTRRIHQNTAPRIATAATTTAGHGAPANYRRAAHVTAGSEAITVVCER